MSASFDVGVGRILVERRLLTPDQVEEALARPGEGSVPGGLPIGLVETGRMTVGGIAEVLETHTGALVEYDPRVLLRAHSWKLAALALAEGRLSVGTALSALREQARRVHETGAWAPLGALLVELGAMPQGIAADLEGRSAPADRDPLRDGVRAPTAGGIRAANAETVEARPAASASPTLLEALPGPRAGGEPSPTVLDATEEGARAPGVAPHPAQRIGQYEWTEVLGRGGMGIVYKAYHPGLKCFYAVKALQAGDAATAEAVQRFHKEAEALAKLRHPGIVGVHDIWKEGGRTYLAMEFVEGKTLDARIARPESGTGGRLPGREAARIAAEVAEAIQYAHDMGVLHRDLKPSNVIVDPRGRVKVMDFGLAKIVDAGEAQVTRTGVLVGTPCYMSPEQVDDGMRAVDAQSDVYQIGAILYEMLCGRPPYVGDGAMDTLMRVSRDDPEAPGRVKPGIDRDVETICLKAMARERSARYRNARELAEDCRRWLDGEAIRARRQAVWEKTWRWARRRKALTALASAVIAALALAGAFAWHARSVEREKAELEEQVLRTLRMISQTNLEATLMVRRSGGSLREARSRFLGPLEEAAREAVAKLPTLAEPHHHLGRMYRALLVFEAARSEQEAALGKDPDHPLARYEHALLTAHFLGQRVLTLRDDWAKSEGRRLASKGALERVQSPDDRLRPRPPDEELIEADGAAQALRDRLIVDLERLDRVVANAPDAISPARLSCARGLFRLHRGRKGEQEEAQRLLEEALAADPGLEEAVEGLAMLHHGRGRYDAAIAALDRGVAQDPGYAPFWYERGQAYSDRGQWAEARGADSDADYERGDQDLSRAIELNPDAAEYWQRRGKLRTRRGIGHEAWSRDPVPTYRLALADHDRAIGMNPSLPGGHHARGNTHCDLGIYRYLTGHDPTEDWQAAAADYTRALEAAPESAGAWMDRGNLGVNWANRDQTEGVDPSGRYAQAEADFTRALELDPGSADAWIWRGMLRSNWGVWMDLQGQDPISRYEAAIGDFDRALEITPKFAKSWMWRGNAFANWGIFEHTRGRDPLERYERAVADLSRALEIHPRLAEARTFRARVLSHWAVVLETSGRDPLPLYDRALADLDEVVAGAPAFPDAWVSRGMVRVNVGIYRYSRGQDPEALWRGAEEDYGTALERNPKLIEAHLRRARVRGNLGVLEQSRGRDATPFFLRSVEDFEAATRLNPNSAEIWTGLGSVLNNWGAYRAARKEDPLPQLRDAVAALDRATALNPSHGGAWMYKASAQGNAARQTLRGGGDPSVWFEQARNSSEAAVRLNPRSAAAWESYGNLETTWAEHAERHGGEPRGHAEAAVAHFTRALQENPRYAEACWRRGQVLHSLGRHEEAVADFERAQALNPRSLPHFEAKLAAARRRLEERRGTPDRVDRLEEAKRILASGDWPRARAAFEAALDGSEGDPAGATPESVEALRAARAGASLSLARLLAQASAGREMANSAPVSLPPEESARLRDRAFRHLDAALEFGAESADRLEADADLAPLHADPRWSSLMARIRAGAH